MRWKQIEDEPKTFALIFETGDEIASVMQQFARGQSLAQPVTGTANGRSPESSRG